MTYGDMDFICQAISRQIEDNPDYLYFQAEAYVQVNRFGNVIVEDIDHDSCGLFEKKQELEDEIDNLHDDIFYLENQKGEVEDDLEQLERDIDEKEEERITLEQEIEKLKKQKRELRGEE